MNRPHQRSVRPDRPPVRVTNEAPPNAVSPWVKLRSITFHPFIFARMIDGADPLAKPGDVVNVYDKRGDLFARGLYNPKSQIAVRVLARGDVAIDDAFWNGKISPAVALRKELGLDAVTDAYRLVHAEGDGLSGLVVERYADCLVFEMFSLGMYERIEMLARAVAASLGTPRSINRPDQAASEWRVYVRADEAVQRMEGFKVNSSLQPDVGTITVTEHGVRYRVNVAEGHKTGFFCDQRDNRRRFASYCGDASVLDLCCYTGGFSLCAATLGNAKDVTAVDLDEKALTIAKENAKLNQARVHFAQADAFAYLREMIANRRTFDRVILDPPKFATSRAEIEKAMHKYQDLNELAMQVVRPGGLLLTCSCSGLVSRDDFANIVMRAARHQNRSFQVLDASGAGPDHPIDPDCPESSYLKTLTLSMR